MKDVPISDLRVCDVFVYDAKYYEVIDDSVYLNGVLHVLAFMLGDDFSYPVPYVIVSPVALFSPDCIVSIGGDFYED